MVVVYLEPLEGLLLCDSDVRLLQRHRTKTVVKVVETLGGINTQEGGHVLVDTYEMGEGVRESEEERERRNER